MQRIFTAGKAIQRTTRPSVVASQRAFASSPQPNPFDKSIKTSLEHAGQKHNFYKLPALADSRICKYLVVAYAFSFLTAAAREFSPYLTCHSATSLLHPYPFGECRQKLWRLRREGGRCRENPWLGEELWARNWDPLPPCPCDPSRFHVSSKINYKWSTLIAYQSLILCA